MMRKLAIVFLLLLIYIPLANASPQTCPTVKPVPGHRYIVVISDLHFGIGRNEKGWDETEDFRWGSALNSFLKRISLCGKEAVDLVIAGDALELWQPPPEIKCEGANPDTGCSVEEYLALTQRIVSAHKENFRAIGSFADKGTNRVFFVPGNHDAALLLDGPWEEVYRAVASNSGRVFRCAKNSEKPCTKTGLWVSEGDGRVVIEHGHQIGIDVNRFPRWPDILVNVGETQYVERPWGQLFVQRLFNEEEKHYPIIDNLTPESAGARYRMADRGFWKSAGDMARFLRFNLLETSFTQKLITLGNEGKDKSNEVNIQQGRKLGYQLFAETLPENDPFRKKLEGKDNDAAALREELNRQLADPSQVSDAEVRQLCNQRAIRSNGQAACGSSMGGLMQKLAVPKHDVLASHLKKRLLEDELKRMRLFIYAHTHELESEWQVDVGLPYKIRIHNTGAFQRLVNEEGFINRAKGINPSDALRRLQVENLPPCYTAVVVRTIESEVKGLTVQWHFEDGKEGAFVLPGDSLCK